MTLTEEHRYHLLLAAGESPRDRLGAAARGLAEAGNFGGYQRYAKKWTIGRGCREFVVCGERFDDPSAVRKIACHFRVAYYHPGFARLTTLYSPRLSRAQLKRISLVGHELDCPKKVEYTVCPDELPECWHFIMRYMETGGEMHCSPGPGSTGWTNGNYDWSPRAERIYQETLQAVGGQWDRRAAFRLARKLGWLK